MIGQLPEPSPRMHVIFGQPCTYHSDYQILPEMYTLESSRDAELVLTSENDACHLRMHRLRAPDCCQSQAPELTNQVQNTTHNTRSAHKWQQLPPNVDVL